MSTEIENLSASFGLVKRELKDARAVLSRLDHQTRKLFEPSAGRASPHDLLTTTLTCHAVSQRNARPAASAAADLYGNDASVLAALASPGLNLGRRGVSSFSPRVSPTEN